MKRIFALLLICCLSLAVFAGCGSSETNNNSLNSNPIQSAVSNHQTDANATYEDFLKYLQTDYAYKAFRCYGEDSESAHDHYVETYSEGTKSYFSLICEDEEIDYIIKYNTDFSADEKPLIFMNSEWVNSEDAINSFHIYIIEYLFSVAISSDNAIDNTIELYGETYPCKQTVIEDGIYVDYLCRNGKWDAISVSSSETDDIMIFENFRFADAPSSDSRIASTLNAPENSNDVTYYEIKSEVMSPALQMGKMYRFEKRDFDTIEVDDIVLVTYNRDGYEFTMAHRVVEITAEGLILRGDNNSVNDDHTFTEDEIIGVLVKE